jgi:uncharacterized protein (DUF2235 family)
VIAGLAILKRGGWEAIMSKNIVLCCDGTSNDATGDITNVLRLFVSLVCDEGQLCYYDGGVGTLVDPTAITRIRKLIRRKIDLAIGYSLRDNFCKAYRFLARRYEPGDRIFLFGFSRGAYTVRALAGAIHRMGVLREELDSLAEYAWAAYSNDMQDLDERGMFRAEARFAKYFSRSEDTRVHFLGAFDTVSSRGWIWDYRTLPNTAHNPSIAHVCHAVAIDERRACFGANLFRPKKPDQHESFREVWFPGVHADVGGGYPEEESGLAKIALQWMLHEADAKGLRLDKSVAADLLGAKKGYSAPDSQAMLHLSLEGFWRLIEWCPRRTWTVPPGAMRCHGPNLGRERPRPESEPCVHQAALDRMQAQPDRYRPSLLNGSHTIQPWTPWPV